MIIFSCWCFSSENKTLRYFLRPELICSCLVEQQLMMKKWERKMFSRNKQFIIHRISDVAPSEQQPCNVVVDLCSIHYKSKDWQSPSPLQYLQFYSLCRNTWLLLHESPSGQKWDLSRLLFCTCLEHSIDIKLSEWAAIATANTMEKLF